MDINKLDGSVKCCFNTQSEQSHREKNYSMLNLSDFFMKKWPFREIFLNFTKCKKRVSISWNGHLFMKRSISRIGYDRYTPADVLIKIYKRIIIFMVRNIKI